MKCPYMIPNELIVTKMNYNPNGSVASTVMLKKPEQRECLEIGCMSWDAEAQLCIFNIDIANDHNDDEEDD